MEVLGTLASRTGGLDGETVVSVLTSSEDPRRARGYGSPEPRVYANWRNAAEQEAVTRAIIAAKITPNTSVQLGTTGDVAHYRYLRLTWRDGRRAEIRLDQGLSGMRVAGGNARFNIEAAVDRQVQDLSRVSVAVEAPAAGAAPRYVQEPG